MNIDGLYMLIRRECARFMGERRDSCLGFVTNYNPDTYSVKVALQPWNAMTGWLPIGALHTGQGFGIYAGPNIGDQVTVGFANGEPSWVISRNFNVGAPLPVPSGELWQVHASGACVKLTNDGALTLADAHGNLVLLNATGLGVTGSAAVTIVSSSQVNVQAPAVNVAATLVTSAGAWTHTGDFNVNGAINDISGSVGVLP